MPNAIFKAPLPRRLYTDLFMHLSLVPMPSLRILALILGIFFATISTPQNAYSQLRAASPATIAPLPKSVAADEGILTPETGADSDRFYDEKNPDEQALQKGAAARSGLPLDKRGAIDWMAALRSGAITPRADLHGTKSQEVLDLDILLKNTKEMPYVKFPHRAHTEWLACSNCHNNIFIPKAGANPITMEKIFRGQYCGTCHDRVAFITHYACERCHSVPQSNGKKWW
jgi:c(7)-type cytochrome triheme protein